MGELIHLNEHKAEEVVETYMKNEGAMKTTQQILTEGAVPRLQGYIVQPGKVSDSIYGGKGSFVMKAEQWYKYQENMPHDNYKTSVFQDGNTTKVKVEFENPELNSNDGKALRIMVRSERISTHDKGRGVIPFKDQILAENHNYMRELVKAEVGTSQYDVEGLSDRDVVIAAENLTPVLFENVMRQYMARTTTSTSMFQHWLSGKKEFAGRPMPIGLYANCKLDELWDTPSTKDENDMTISSQWLVDNGICTMETYKHIMQGSFGAFRNASGFLDSRGIILVDTKIEQGEDSSGIIKSQDELFTMDSSRFWDKIDYNTQLKLFLEGKSKELAEYIQDTQPGIKKEAFTLGGLVCITPKSFSKEFARGFSKGDDMYTNEQRAKIAVRYIMGIQNLLNRPFEPDMRPREQKVVEGLEIVVEKLAA